MLKRNVHSKGLGVWSLLVLMSILLYLVERKQQMMIVLLLRCLAMQKITWDELYYTLGMGSLMRGCQITQIRLLHGGYRGHTLAGLTAAFSQA